MATKLDRSTIPDPPHTLKHDGFTFTVIRKIGEGGFAKCYEVLELLSGRKFALKAIHSKAIAILQAKNKLVNEIDIHGRLNSRYIVKLYRVFQDKDFVYLVLELCENRTMVELLKRKRVLGESEAKHYLWMILGAVKYLHDNKIIHRDLKLGNIFLNLEYDVKVGDFGLATTLGEAGDRKKTMCGTPNYIAPEVLCGRNTGHSYEVDVWAFGIIMYTLLFGKPPFQSGDIPDIYNKIKLLSYTFPSNSNVSETAKELIRLILASDPEKRPKLQEISNHGFFRQVIIREPFSGESEELQRLFRTLQLYAPSHSKENHLQPTIGRVRKPSAVETVYRKLCEYIDEQGRPRLVKDQKEAFAWTRIDDLFYVERWVDYTEKYGIGYLCSNGTTGAHFNDSTTMIYDPDLESIEYHCCSPKEDGQKVTKTTYRVDQCPSELNKKTIIVKHFHGGFAKYIDKKKPKTSGTESVVKYTRVKNAIVFRLSTRSIQVIFDHDPDSVLVCHDGNLVVGLDRGRETYHVLHELFRDSPNSRIVDRLIQLKNILSVVVGGN